ncbi:Tautomerase [Venustampulla echinocandica]|uniref:L-dopachrome isomerase n=1 Tax=Venustampulla echinocandica TaxID=2656787 RepID=A0A370TY18_9HELO|nr:Tautomerase [Venustampulla echinocandica]RDL40413.1 Tautomerase [Venustampulla echinocandica]
MAMSGRSISPDTSDLDREQRRITRALDRGAPGDEAIFSKNKTPQQKELARRKSQYYNDVFAHREPNSSPRDRVSRESMIMTDVKTNVIIQDEYTFITDLSYSLSTRYQRPESSISVTVAHSACLLFGGTFDPAYTMTITALGSQLQPVTNKRNASLLAKAMDEALGVPPNRGLIKFVPVAEENLATGGKTVAGEIEELAKAAAEENANLKRSLSRNALRSTKKQSTTSLRNPKAAGGQLQTHHEDVLTPVSERPTSSLITATSPVQGELDLKDEKVRRVGRRKSFIAGLFGKG